MAKREKYIVMKAQNRKEKRIFTSLVSALSFIALYFTIVSGINGTVFRLTAVIVGAVLALIYGALSDKKTIKTGVLCVAVLYTVLCVAVDFNGFASGAKTFCNDIAHTANANAHRGFVSFSAEYSAKGDFLFFSVVSVWLAYISAVLIRINKLPLILSYAVIILTLVGLGVYPAVYSVALVCVAFVGLLLVDKEFSFSAAGGSLLCAVVLFAAMAPCFFYSGSDSIRGAKTSFVSVWEKTIYGSDNLPEGDLREAYKMRSSEEGRLIVSLERRTRNLYLKGFVGSEFEVNKWRATDKNAYVEGSYRGLLKYISKGGLPFGQYARYSALNGNDDKFSIGIKNIGANKKYIYTPYTLEEFSAGKPYYDLQLRGGLSSPSSYNFTALARNSHCEWISQADWLVSEEGRSAAMDAYMLLEGQYRMFVYDTYLKLGDTDKKIILETAAGTATNSINTATQLMRRYFLDNFIYSDIPDVIESDFITEFFGGKIKTANAAYFATAAAYIFRAQGFAARYAEGYYARSEKASEIGEILITDKNSHAWTEVYFDGIGWLPIEVTPGYFSEDDISALPSPDEPNMPDDPTEPDIPPEEIDRPEEPEDPDIKPGKPSAEDKRGSAKALKISLPIVLIALAAGSFVAAVILRRRRIISKKRKSLTSEGEEYGRAVYGIIARDCKTFGEFSAETLAGFGMTAEETKIFNEIVEKSVYGGYNLCAKEKEFVEDYIKRATNGMIYSGNKLKYLIYKYIKCIGI